jgi:3-hydroxyisobutyrate dehydrogenase
MLTLSECFNVAKNKGMDTKLFHEILLNSSGNSWSNSNYCPYPNILPNSPSSKNYMPGFDISLMIKDLDIAQELFSDRSLECKQILDITKSTFISTKKFMNEDKIDFSSIIKYLESSPFNHSKKE